MDMQQTPEPATMRATLDLESPAAKAIDVRTNRPYNEAVLESMDPLGMRQQQDVLVLTEPGRQLPDAPRSKTPADLLELAINKGASLEQIEKFMALLERWQQGQAKQAFAKAFAAFKAETIIIIRNQTVQDGPLKGKNFADLYGVLEAVTPALSRHGLALSWNITKDEPDWIEVTAILRHVDGYQETVSAGGPPDNGPGRNKMQSRGSTITYAERYTGKAILGVSDKDQDNDGKGVGNEDGKGGGFPPNTPAAGPQRSPEAEAILKEWQDAIRATTTDAEARMEWSRCADATRHNDADYKMMYDFTNQHRKSLKAKLDAARG